jgi:hypothetical protein
MSRILAESVAADWVHWILAGKIFINYITATYTKMPRTGSEHKVHVLVLLELV